MLSKYNKKQKVPNYHDLQFLFFDSLEKVDINQHQLKNKSKNYLLHHIEIW